MYVERLLQVNMGALATLATVLVGMGVRNTIMPVGMLVAAALSIWVTDVKGWIALGTSLANVARLAVLAFCLMTLRLERHALVMQVAWLLVWLQMIVLFQRKETRTYWHLLELTLLQVVVAGLLTQGLMFGLLLVVYMVAGLLALTLLFQYEERNRCQRVPRGPPAAPAGARWPLAHEKPVFSGMLPGRMHVERELWVRVLKMAAASLVLSAVTFLAVPRFKNKAWRGEALGARATVGFSDRVRLGELGRILENPQEVMRVVFLDEATGEPYLIQGEVYFRGAVLTYYDRGQWRPAPPGIVPAILPRRTPKFPRAWSGTLVRQRIQLEAMDRPELFSVWPFIIPWAQRGRVVLEPATRRLLRAEGSTHERFEYELLTTAFRHGQQSQVVPNSLPPVPDSDAGDPGEELVYPGPGPWGVHLGVRLLYQRPEGPPDQPPPLYWVAKLARTWAAESNISPEDAYHLALWFERRLRDSGEFTYTLQGWSSTPLEPVTDPDNPSAPPPVDPVEKFLVQRRQGHCEYFATALAMLLRHVGIPCRLVVGYKTDEWNDVGGYFTVRQLHAHTWVEVFLRPDQIPDHLRQSEDDVAFRRGAWLRLDPTPASRQPGSLLRAITTSKYFDWLDYLWNNYVIEMDRPRQREAIYRPVVGAVRGLAQALTDANWWRRVWPRVWAGLAAAGGAAIAGLALGALLALAAVFWGLARLGKRLRHRFGRAGGAWPFRLAGADRHPVAFYRRLEAILQRYGLQRRPSQTPRELAETARRLLQARHPPELAELPTRVVEAYYRVRFGDKRLDKPEAEAIEQALVALEHAR